MPRRPHFGRPGTPVIPDGWETNHGRVVAATFSCTIAIGPADGASAWDEAAGRTVSQPAAAVYTGPADIGPTSRTGGGEAIDAADDVVDATRLEVKLPRAATEAALVRIGHLVVVTDSTIPALLDARLTVTGFEAADRGFSQILFATLLT